MEEITLDVAPDVLETWLQDPVTKKVMDFITQIRNSAQVGLLEMPTRSYGAERIALEMVRAQGFDEGISVILTLKGELQT